MMFELFFFKKKTVSLDVTDIIKFFDKKDCFELNYENIEEELVINYNNKSFPSNIKLLISKKIVVPNMFKLNPNYKNLNFSLKVPLNVSEYFAHDIFKMIEKLALILDLSIYNSAMNDVGRYDVGRLTNIFRLYQETIHNRSIKIFDNNFFVKQNYIENICRYETFRNNANGKYNLIDIKKIELFSNKSNRDVEIYARILDETNVIIYKNTTHLEINKDNKRYVIDFYRVEPLIKKYLKNIDNFNNSIILSDKSIKYIKKNIKKFISITSDDVKDKIEIHHLIEEVSNNE